MFYTSVFFFNGVSIFFLKLGFLDCIYSLILPLFEDLGVLSCSVNTPPDNNTGTNPYKNNNNHNNNNQDFLPCGENRKKRSISSCSSSSDESQIPNTSELRATGYNHTPNEKTLQITDK